MCASALGLAQTRACIYSNACVYVCVSVSVCLVVGWWFGGDVFGPSRAFSGRRWPCPALRVRAALPPQTPPLKDRFSQRHWHFTQTLSPALSLPILSRFSHCHFHSLSLSLLGMLVYTRVGARTWLHADARKCIGACTGARMCALQCMCVLGGWLVAWRGCFPAVCGRLRP